MASPFKKAKKLLKLEKFINKSSSKTSKVTKQSTPSGVTQNINTSSNNFNSNNFNSNGKQQTESAAPQISSNDAPSKIPSIPNPVSRATQTNSSPNPSTTPEESKQNKPLTTKESILSGNPSAAPKNISSPTVPYSPRTYKESSNYLEKPNFPGSRFQTSPPPTSHDRLGAHPTTPYPSVTYPPTSQSSTTRSTEAFDPRQLIEIDLSNPDKPRLLIPKGEGITNEMISEIVCALQNEDDLSALVGKF